MGQVKTVQTVSTERGERFISLGSVGVLLGISLAVVWC